jgi:hypothetical protein
VSLPRALAALVAVLALSLILWPETVGLAPQQAPAIDPYCRQSSPGWPRATSRTDPMPISSGLVDVVSTSTKKIVGGSRCGS